MTLGSLLDRVRAQYVEDFQAIIDKELARPGVRVIAEPVLRRTDGEVAGEGPWQLPLRKDLAVLEGARPSRFVDVGARRALSFDPIEFAWGDRLDVELAALRWQQVFVEMSGGTSSQWKSLIAWFWRWFKKEVEGSGDLLRVVHFLSDSRVTDGDASFEIDLGSAPVEAFEELLDAIASTGAIRCRFVGAPGRPSR